MTYRVRTLVIAIGLAVAAALLVMMYVTSYKHRVDSTQQQVPVAVAARDIPAGTTGAQIVQEKLIHVEQVARRAIAPGAVSSPDDIARLVALQPTYAGEQVSVHRFGPIQAEGVRSQLTGTYRAMQIAGTPNQILADWMEHGYGSYMGLGWYWSDAGAKFNGNDMQDALATVRGHDVLFPIYDQVQGQGTNFQYRVVGWAAFRLTGYAGHGNSGTLTGYFTSITWDGIQAQPPSEDFGAHVIQLVE